MFAHPHNQKKKKQKKQQTSIVNWSMAKKNSSLTIVKLLLFVAAGTKFKWRKKKIPIFSYWSYFKLSCHTLYKLTRWTHYYLSYFFYFYRFSFDNLGVSLCVVWCFALFLIVFFTPNTHMYRIVSSLSNELKYIKKCQYIQVTPNNIVFGIVFGIHSLGSLCHRHQNNNNKRSMVNDWW